MSSKIWGPLESGDFLSSANPVYPETKTDIWRLDLCIPPVANFSGSPLSGDFPLSVVMTDLSTNDPTTWEWKINGSVVSTLRNPTLSFTSAGDYDISLYVTNDCGEDTELKDNYITATTPVTGHLVTFEEPGGSTGEICNGPILTFYDGGTIQLDMIDLSTGDVISSRNVTGPDWGIVFPNTRAQFLVDKDAGSGIGNPYLGNFANEPSPSTVLTWTYDSDTETDVDTSQYINVAGGFITQFDFYWCCPVTTFNISLWTGVNGTGTQLATSGTLGGNGGGAGDPTGGAFGIWTLAHMPFSGTCQSVKVSFKFSRLLLDNLEFGEA